MDVDFAFLCDYAESAGKLHAMGIGIDTVYVESFPGAHHGIYVVFQLRFEPTEDGDKDLRVFIMGPDGEQMARIEGKIHVARPAEAGRSSGTRFVFPIRPLPLAKAGDYAVIIQVQGINRKEVRFHATDTRPGDQSLQTEGEHQ